MDHSKKYRSSENLLEIGLQFNMKFEAVAVDCTETKTVSSSKLDKECFSESKF
jgi:hypothetical protein